MTDDSIPIPDRQAFVAHVARLRQHCDRLHAQFDELGVTPVTLAPVVVEVLESGSAMTITVLRSELKQAVQLVADAEAEIETHEKQITALQNDLAAETSRAHDLQLQLNARNAAGEPPPAPVPAPPRQPRARTMAPAKAPMAIDPLAARVLLLLRERDSAAAVEFLAARLAVLPEAVTAAIENLAARKLVERRDLFGITQWRALPPPAQLAG